MSELRNDFSLARLANQENFDVNELRQAYVDHANEGELPKTAELGDKHVLLWMRQQIQREGTFTTEVSINGLKRLQSAARTLGSHAIIDEMSSGRLHKLKAIFTRQTAHSAKLGAQEVLATVEKSKLNQTMSRLSENPGFLSADERKEFIHLIGSALPKQSKSERAEFIRGFCDTALMQDLISGIDKQTQGPTSAENRAFTQLCKVAYANGELHKLLNLADIPENKQKLVHDLAKSSMKEAMRESLTSKFSLSLSHLSKPKGQSFHIPLNTDTSIAQTQQSKLASNLIADAALDVVQEQLHHPKQQGGENSIRAVVRESLASQISFTPNSSNKSAIKITIPTSCGQSSSPHVIQHAMQKAHQTIASAITRQQMVQTGIGITDADDATDEVRNALLQENIGPMEYDLLSVWVQGQPNIESSMVHQVYDLLRTTHESHAADTISRASDNQSLQEVSNLAKLLYEVTPSYENLVKIAQAFQTLQINVPADFPDSIRLSLHLDTDAEAPVEVDMSNEAVDMSTTRRTSEEVDMSTTKITADETNMSTTRLSTSDTEDKTVSKEDSAQPVIEVIRDDVLNDDKISAYVFKIQTQTRRGEKGNDKAINQLATFFIQSETDVNMKIALERCQGIFKDDKKAVLERGRTRSLTPQISEPKVKEGKFANAKMDPAIMFQSNILLRLREIHSDPEESLEQKESLKEIIIQARVDDLYKENYKAVKEMLERSPSPQMRKYHELLKAIESEIEFSNP